MTPDVSRLLREWDRDLSAPSSPTFVEDGEFLEFLALQLFDSYEPTAGASHAEFRNRLRDWLAGVGDDASKKKMVRLATRILFFGAKEFEMLYSSVVQRCVLPWLIDQLNLKLDQSDLLERMNCALSETWFTGITESMRLASFYHINNIEGVDWRLNWHDAIHANVAVPTLVDYMARHSLKRIVVLEDFAGSGSQLSTAAGLFQRLPVAVPILVAPLFVCKGAMEVGKCLAQNRSGLTFSPLAPLQADSFISEQPVAGEAPLHAEIRELALSVHAKVVGSNWAQNYGPFGFGRMGGLVVMHTNCPDNTLPLIHRTSDGPWHALFPRSSRL